MSDPLPNAQCRTSRKAVVALILGLCSFCVGVLGVPAFVLGAVAKHEIERSSGVMSGGGMAACGMALGCLGLLVNCIGFVAIGIYLES